MIRGIGGMRRALLPPLLVVAAVVSGCTLLASKPAEEEEAPEKGVDVVKEEKGTFDPSEAVTDPGESEQEATQPEIESPAEETTTDAVAEAREKQREEAVERAGDDGEDEDRAKEEIARNPPPADRGAPEPLTWTYLDVLLEGLLLLLLALAITGLAAAFRRHLVLSAVAATLVGLPALFLLRSCG